MYIMLDFLTNITGVSQVYVCNIEILRTSKIYNLKFSNTPRYMCNNMIFFKHLHLNKICQHKDKCTMTFEVQDQRRDWLWTDKQMRKSVEKLKVQERKFNNIQLKCQVKGVDWSRDNHFKTLNNNAARNLKITTNYADKFRPNE